MDIAPLTSFPEGDSVEIHVLGVGDKLADRLRSLGLREGCCARVMSTGDKCVLAVGECRIALRREVAMGLMGCSVSGR
ncbi:MAG: ferrous iron transport protein A [Rhodothermales bacterium]|nr:ferrous iron transport protein A [Rhodothermales bacterium]MBO6778166.1 ferrous iron transport protein A [Rhodothermales bacterium]